jgi:hypothetical protein
MYNKEAVYRYRRNNPDWRKKYLSKHGDAAKNCELRSLRKRRSLINALKNKPCIDCRGWFSPWQMDFDHLDSNSKVCNVSQIKSVKRLIEESKKCDLVCANCHRERTHNRFLLTGGAYVQR